MGYINNISCCLCSCSRASTTTWIIEIFKNYMQKASLWKAFCRLGVLNVNILNVLRNSFQVLQVVSHLWRRSRFIWYSEKSQSFVFGWLDGQSSRLKYQTSIPWINMKLGTHIQAHLRMNCNDSDDHLTIILALSTLTFVLFLTKYLLLSIVLMHVNRPSCQSVLSLH